MLHCKVSSRITDDRPGYVQRNGKKHKVAEIHFGGDGDGHTIDTYRYRTNVWRMEVDSIDYPTLRDTLWAVRTLMIDPESIREVYLDWDCHVPLRVSVIICCRQQFGAFDKRIAVRITHAHEHGNYLITHHSHTNTYYQIRPNPNQFPS